MGIEPVLVRQEDGGSRIALVCGHHTLPHCPVTDRFHKTLKGRPTPS